MKQTPLQRKTPLKASAAVTREFQRRGRQKTASTTRRRPISEASPAQRLAVKGKACLIPGCPGSPVDPCHLVPRGMLGAGQDDALAVIGLCRSHHRLLDSHQLDLIPYESLFREQMSYAVYRAGIVNVLERLSGTRWRPVEQTA